MGLALALALPLAAHLSAPCDASGAAPAGEKLALLVGIDRYAPGTPAVFSNLNGCVRDTVRVRELLVGRFGFAPADIRTLTDEEATHGALVRAFHEHLIARAGPDTEVVFWFSGHGSRVPDRSGAAAAEKDKKDSTLLAWDSRLPGLDGAWDFCDDELRSLLFALTRKTARVTVVTDACHSGGATRGGPEQGAPRTRGADEGKLPLDRERLLREAWPAGVDLLDDGDQRPDETGRHVHIAACAPEQLAQEVDFERDDGTTEPGGALTFFLTQALDRAQPGVTWRDVAEQAAMRLAMRLANQNVRYQGALARELFGARFAERPPGFLARAAGAGVRIEAGSMHFLAKDSIVAIHGQDGSLVGRARVGTAGVASSSASWLEPAPAKAPEGALRAIEETRPVGQEPLALHVADAELARELAKSDRVRLLPEARADAYRVTRAADGTFAFVEPSGLELWAGRAPVPPGPETLASLIDKALRAELRHRALDALALQPGALRVAASFRAPTAEELVGWKADVRAGHVRSAISAASGGTAAGRIHSASGTATPEVELALAMIDVENPTATALHVSILSVTESRGCALIWPLDAGERDRPLGPGERLAPVPVNVTLPATWPAGRPMRDRYLVIATRDGVDLSPLVTGEVLRSSDPMPAVLQAAMEGPRLRGGRSVRVDRADWGIAALELLVERGPAVPGPGR